MKIPDKCESECEKKELKCSLPLTLSLFLCRGEKTRTSGPYVPNVVRYQLRYTPKKLCAKLTKFSNLYIINI